MFPLGSPISGTKEDLDTDDATKIRTLPYPANTLPLRTVVKSATGEVPQSPRLCLAEVLFFFSHQSL